MLSEGQNLQDSAVVVNYDLPWAIIRLIQRAGRVDRIGQKAEQILCYSFLPADGVDRIIRLRERVRQRLRENAEVVGTDEAFFEDDRNDHRPERPLQRESRHCWTATPTRKSTCPPTPTRSGTNAIAADPSLEQQIQGLPSVVYSTKAHAPTGPAPEGVLVYLRTAQGNDALAWIDRAGKSITESQFAVLDAAACTPDTPALPRHASHHQLVRRAVERAADEEKQVGGQLGRPSGARFRTYERLKRYARAGRGDPVRVGKASQGHRRHLPQSAPASGRGYNKSPAAVRRLRRGSGPACRRSARRRQLVSHPGGGADAGTADHLFDGSAWEAVRTEGMAIHFERTRDRLKQFEFHALFVEELGWSQPTARKTVEFTVKDSSFTRRPIAELAGVVVLEIEAEDGKMPDAPLRLAVHKEIAKHYHENLLIFIDHDRTQSLWYWVKRQDGKLYPRDHLYLKGQPGDLFISKLGQIVFDLSDFDAEGNVGVVEVAARLRAAWTCERITKRFYGQFQEQHTAFLELIAGIPDERQRRWYASVLLNRLMFIYFLQKKGFVDGGDLNYLRGKLVLSKERGKDRYFRDFLKPLFFEGFAKPPDKRSPGINALIGAIRYLNGGLFLPHRVELDNPDLDVCDRAFENLFGLFERYSWNLDDTPGGKDDEINPDVLGYIFEKYINQKAFGAYYTRTEITDYLCERTIHRLILDAVNTPDGSPIRAIVGVRPRKYDTLGDLLIDLDADLCRRLLLDVLPRLSLLDPACGSGAFLVAAMKTLINVYSAVIGRIKFVSDRTLSQWLKEVERDAPQRAVLHQEGNHHRQPVRRGHHG